MDRVPFRARGVAEIPDFALQLLEDLTDQQDGWIANQMTARGIAPEDLHCYVLEYHPVETIFDKKSGRLKFVQEVRLRHLTDEELKEREALING